jgi:uncharacterized protein (TIGR03437 family)
LSKKNIATLQPAWTFSAPSMLGSAGTLSSGVFYVGDWDGYFHALNAQNGAEIWNTFLGKAPDPANPLCEPGIGITSQSTVLGNTVYVGGGDSAVYALDVATGAKIWRAPLADPASGAYLWGSVVPYQNQLYGLALINPQNPQQPLVKYLVPTDELGAGIWATPAIDPATNTLFATTGNGDTVDFTSANLSETMVSLDARTLEIKSYYRLPEDEAPEDFDWGSSPVLFTAPNGVAMTAASAKDGFLYALRRDNLSLVWKIQLAVGCDNPQGGCGSLSTPAFDGTILFAAAGVRDPEGFSLGSIYAIHPADGSILWQRDTDGVVIAPVSTANGMVFLSTTQGLEIYDGATGQFLWCDGKRGLLYSQAVVTNGTVFSNYLTGDVVAWRLPASGSNAIYNYSAATGFSGLAPGAIASAFGSGLTAFTIQDSAGTVFKPDVLVSTPNQVNFVVPDGAAVGQATVSAMDTHGQTLSSAIQVSAVAPGLFSANADGKGVAAAQALVVHADGSRNSLPVFQCGSAPGSCVATPIDLGAASDHVFLILYGTGLRGATALLNVSCTIGGVPAPVSYAGPQNGFEGLDQVNVQIPRGLAGSGQVALTLSVDRQLSNTVAISIK